MSRTFGKIEKYSNAKFPKLLKKILIQSGFNTEFSLISIDSENLKTIENFVQNNRNILIKSKYENRDPFRFDLGDKTAILSLPKIIKNANKENTDKKDNKNIENFNEIDSKKQLVEKVQNFLVNKKIAYSFGIDSVVNVRISEKAIKFLIKCPTCKQEFSCIKNPYWKIGNLTKHILKHLKTNTVPSTPNTAVQSAAAVVKRIDHIADLNSILR